MSKSSLVPLRHFEQPIHAPRNVEQPLLAAAADFRAGPAVVADLAQRFDDFRPAVVAFAEFDVEALSQPEVVALLAAVFLDVQFQDALAEDADPLLGPA